jgi:protein O-mannosyl-transferase
VSTVAASRRRGYRVFAAFGIVVLVTIVAFLPVLRADFVSWDDNRNFLGNPDYRGLGVQQLRWMWTTTLMGHYVPLTWMSLGLDYVLWGMNPAGYHAVNLLFHAVNAGLLFFTARMVFRSSDHQAPSDAILPAAVAALAFSIHPLRVESVAWVTERRDVLSMTFYLASLMSYLRAVRASDARRWYGLAVALFVCALLSKATAVTLPAVLVLANIYPLRRLATRPQRLMVAREVAPFAGLAAATGLLSLFVLHPPAQLTIVEKLAASAYSLGFYLWKTALPLSLAPLYPLPQQLDPLRWQFLVGYAVCGAYAVGVGLAWQRSRGLSVGMIAFLAMLLPFLGIVQNGPQIAADRYTYHAATALALIAGGALVRWDAKGLRLLTFGVLAWWGVLTWDQCDVWRDSDHLWSRVLRVDSSSTVGLFGLGDVRLAQGRDAEALDLYQKAVGIDTAYAEGHNNLGVLYARQGDYQTAIREHRLAIQYQPMLAEAHANLGVALARTGQDSAAIAEFERTIALDPRNARAHLNLGVQLARTGRFESAIREFEQALSIDPRLDDARTYLDEARRQLSRARPPRD